MTTRILLADDHQIMREGLRSLLECEPDFEIVGEADNGRTAVRMARELRPDIVVMDIGMPDLNGVEATRQIKAELKHTKVVGLSMHSDRRFVEGMLAAGAVGYVLKSGAFEDVVEAIHTVSSNQIFTSPKITELVLDVYIRSLNHPEPEARETPLTPREREVLQLLAEGRSSRDIAEELCISGNTVDTHRRRIMEKLDLHSIAELTKYAVREGLTDIEV